MSTTEPTPDLVASIEDACAPVQVATTSTLYFTFEALHELSVQLGDLFHDEFHPIVDRLDALDTDGDVREALGAYNAELRIKFECWARDHGLPHLTWWCMHSYGAGAYMRWRIEAAP